MTSVLDIDFDTASLDFSLNLKQYDLDPFPSEVGRWSAFRRANIFHRLWAHRKLEANTASKAPGKTESTDTASMSIAAALVVLPSADNKSWDIGGAKNPDTKGVGRRNSLKRLIRTTSNFLMKSRSVVSSPSRSANSFNESATEPEESDDDDVTGSIASSVSSISLKFGKYPLKHCKEHGNSIDNCWKLKPILKNRNDNFEIEFKSVKQQDLVNLEQFLINFEANESNRLKENFLDMRLLQLSNYYNHFKS